MEKNLTIVGICAFLAFVGYTYVKQAQNTNTIQDNKYVTKSKIEKEHNLMFDKGDSDTYCSDPKACNYNENVKPEYIDNDKCEYKFNDCDTCSGDTDGTGKVIDNDYNDDGVCDNWDTLTQAELDKILNNLEEKDSLAQLSKRTLDLYIPHDSDPKTNSTNVMIDATASFDIEGDSIRYYWSSNDVSIKEKRDPIIQFKVKSLKDSINIYQVNLKLTDDYGGTAKDSVIINVHDEENLNPKSIIYKMEIDELTEEITN